MFSSSNQTFNQVKFYSVSGSGSRAIREITTIAQNFENYNLDTPSQNFSVEIDLFRQLGIVLDKIAFLFLEWMRYTSTGRADDRELEANEQATQRKLLSYFRNAFNSFFQKFEHSTKDVQSCDYIDDFFGILDELVKNAINPLLDTMNLEIGNKIEVLNLQAIINKKFSMPENFQALANYNDSSLNISSKINALKEQQINLKAISSAPKGFEINLAANSTTSQSSKIREIEKEKLPPKLFYAQFVFMCNILKIGDMAKKFFFSSECVDNSQNWNFAANFCAMQHSAEYYEKLCLEVNESLDDVISWSNNPEYSKIEYGFLCRIICQVGRFIGRILYVPLSHNLPICIAKINVELELRANRAQLSSIDLTGITVNTAVKTRENTESTPLDICHLQTKSKQANEESLSLQFIRVLEFNDHHENFMTNDENQKIKKLKIQLDIIMTVYNKIIQQLEMLSPGKELFPSIEDKKKKPFKEYDGEKIFNFTEVEKKLQSSENKNKGATNNQPENKKIETIKCSSSDIGMDLSSKNIETNSNISSNNEFFISNQIEILDIENTEKIESSGELVKQENIIMGSSSDYNEHMLPTNFLGRKVVNKITELGNLLETYLGICTDNQSSIDYNTENNYFYSIGGTLDDTLIDFQEWLTENIESESLRIVEQRIQKTVIKKFTKICEDFSEKCKASMKKSPFFYIQEYIDILDEIILKGIFSLFKIMLSVVENKKIASELKAVIQNNFKKAPGSAQLNTHFASPQIVQTFSLFQPADITRIFSENIIEENVNSLPIFSAPNIGVAHSGLNSGIDFFREQINFLNKMLKVGAMSQQYQFFPNLDSNRLIINQSFLIKLKIDIESWAAAWKIFFTCYQNFSKRSGALKDEAIRRLVVTMICRVNVAIINIIATPIFINLWLCFEKIKNDFGLVEKLDGNARSDISPPSTMELPTLSFSFNFDNSIKIVDPKDKAILRELKNLTDEIMCQYHEIVKYIDNNSGRSEIFGVEIRNITTRCEIERQRKRSGQQSSPQFEQGHELARQKYTFNFGNPKGDEASSQKSKPFTSMGAYSKSL